MSPALVKLTTVDPALTDSPCDSFPDSRSVPGPLTVVQVLPALESGGVERGTLEVAGAITQRGWRSIVISARGRLVEPLRQTGSEHVAWPIGRKSPASLAYVSRLRKLLIQQRVDVLHARSRMPAWIAWLAWRLTPRAHRPAWITTMHGLHSVNRYSRIMTTGQQVIAVSHTVQQHILACYPGTDPAKIHVIPRGVSPEQFPHGYQPSPHWHSNWQQQFPQLAGKRIITLPGRITRLKGHADLIELIARLNQRGHDVVGLVVGDEDPRRLGYAQQMRQLADRRAPGRIVWAGHRSDMREIYAVSDVVLSLSNRPESFGRTVLEALSLGRPVAGYDHGGVGEVLSQLLPQGAVPLGDLDRLTQVAAAFLDQPPIVPMNRELTLERMLARTLDLYVQAAQANLPQAKGRRGDEE